MALTQVTSGGLKDDAVIASKISDDAVTEALIADDSIDEARLKISNSGSNGQFLQKQSGNTGGLTWTAVDLTALSASNLTSGTVPDARFPATLPAASGVNLTALNASNISSGTVGTARLGSGTASSSTYLRGDNSWATVTSVGGATGVDFNDGVKIHLGDSDELKIWHDSNSHSYITESGAGGLAIGGSMVSLMNVATTEYYFKGTENGAVELYYDNAKKLETTSTGVTITGGVTASTASTFNGQVSINAELYFEDNDKANFGNGADLKIYHNGSHSRIDNDGTGNLYINAASGETGISIIKNGSIDLYYDNSKKAETVSGGFTVTGTCTATSFAGDGSNLTGISGGPGTGESYVKLFTGATASNSGTNTIAGYNAGAAITGNTSNCTFYGKEAGNSVTGECNATAIGERALSSLTDGQGNTAIGQVAMRDTTSGGYNVAVGNNTLLTQTTGHSNVAIGYQAGDAITTGTHNVCLGRAALSSITVSHDNTAIGSGALESSSTSAAQNVAVGREALKVYEHSQAVAIGDGALKAATTANHIVAVGYEALNYLTTGGDHNTAVGFYASNRTTTGTHNTSLGSYALYANTTGNYNIAIGFEALKSATTGGGNIAIGHKACNGGAITGANNVAVGLEAMKSISGNVNGSIAIGYRAAYSQTGDCYQTAVGYEACYTNTTLTGNTGIGHKALRESVAGQNTAVGSEAGTDLTTAHSAVFVGWSAGSKCTTGSRNVAVGRDSFGHGAASATTAEYCVAVGDNALNDVTTGGFNYAVGANAGQKITTGTDNVLMGYAAGGTLTTGTTNCAVGCGALQNEASISGNAAMGKFAGLNCGGNNNVYIGNNAGHSHHSGNNSVIIGNEANYNQESGSNVLFIARGNVAKGSNSCWIYGDGDGNVIRAGNGTAWATTSDARIKKNIVDNNVGLSLINQVKIRNFEYRTEDEIDRTNFGGKADDPKWTADEAKEMNSVTEGEYKTKYGIDQSGTQLGVIAQELETVAPRCVKTDATGKKTVDSTELLWHMLNAIKELSAKVETLENA